MEVAIAKYIKEMIRLGSMRVLNHLYASALPFFESSSCYRVSCKKIRNELDRDNIVLKNRIYYLKKMGFIETFVEGKERYFEITPKGLERVSYNLVLNPKISRPSSWDGKWRLAIFDIPNAKKYHRDSFRIKLLELGFIKIQESIYVYPFECTNEVAALSGLYNVSQFVLILIADIIQGEEEIINNFLDRGVLIQSDLKSQNKSARADKVS